MPSAKKPPASAPAADVSPGGARKRRNPVEDGPRLFKRGRWWAADLRPWGGARPTLRDAKGERTEFRDVARAWAEGEVAKLRGRTHDRQRGIKPRRPLKAAVDEFRDHRRATVEHNTWLNDVNVTGHLLDAFGKRDLHAIGQDEIQAWFDARAATYAPGTLDLYRIHMRTFFAWAGRPIEKPKLNKANKRDPDALSDDEVDALLGAIKTERENVVVRVGLATGARRAELWGLEWTDFRPDGRSVRIQRQVDWPKSTNMKGLKGKRNRTTLVLPGFMDPLPRQAAGRVIPGWVLNEKEASAVFVRVMKRAGAYRIGRATHVMRHTFARIGLEKYGWSLEMLKAFLGHSSIKTTEIYAHFGEEVALRMARERTYGKA